MNANFVTAIKVGQIQTFQNGVILTRPSDPTPLLHRHTHTHTQICGGVTDCTYFLLPSDSASNLLGTNAGTRERREPTQHLFCLQKLSCDDTLTIIWNKDDNMYQINLRVPPYIPNNER